MRNKPNVVWKPNKGSQPKFLACPVWECLLHGNRGGGKGFLPEEKVLTPQGWSTMEELEEGSIISNPDGSSQKVLAVYKRDPQQIYGVVFEDGTKIKCDGDHLWFARLNGEPPAKYMPLNFNGRIHRTEDLYNIMKENVRIRPIIPCNDPINFEEEWIDEVDAYTMGILLGVGDFSDKEINVKIADKEIYDLLRKKGSVSNSIDPESKMYTCKFLKGSLVFEHMTESGLELVRTAVDKFIPERIMLGSVEDRLAFIQGLMDSDGSIDISGDCGISSISRQLLEDTRHLVLSLGGWAVLSEEDTYYEFNGEKKLGPRVYTILIQFPYKTDLFRLERKQNKCSESPDSPYLFDGRLTRRIKNIARLKEKLSTICIVVDNPNRLFITRDFVVTHNTDVLIMDYLQGVGIGYGSDYRGLLLREATTELGDVIAKCKKWIPKIFPTANYNNSKKIWTFKDGETLWLNYARTEEDYDQYHGHEYSISTTTLVDTDYGRIPAGEVEVGFRIQTLQGLKYVKNVLTSKKCGVQISLFENDVGKGGGSENGNQIQGILHPVLINGKWRRIGLSLLSEYSEESNTGKMQIKEVLNFLSGIHSEILDVLNRDFYFASAHSVSICASKWYSCLYQISRELLGTIHQRIFKKNKDFSIIEDFLNCNFKNILLSIDQDWKTEHQEFISILIHCSYLINLVSRICNNYIYLLKAELCMFFQENNMSDMQMTQEQVFLYETEAYITNLYTTERILRDLYLNKYEFDRKELIDIVLTTQKVILTDDARGDPFLYNMPYSKDFKNTQLEIIKKPFTISKVDMIIDMVDFEVEDERSYLSYAKIIKDNDYTYQFINQNCWIGWEELTNHPFPNVYLKLMSCNRTSNPLIRPKYRATCNPSGPGNSWVRERFIDATPPGKIFREPLEFEYPNEKGELIKTVKTVSRTHIQSFQSENKSLPPEYMATIYALAKDDPMLIKAWIEGSWDIILGGFFSDVWDKKIHVIDEFIPPRSWKLYRSFDWGSSKPWAVTYGLETNGEQPDNFNGNYIPKNSVIIPTEIYGWNGKVNEGDNATSQEIAERVLEVDNLLMMMYGIKCRIGPADTSIWEVRDGKSIAGNLKSFGCHWTKAYKGSGSRIAGWSIIRQMLMAAKKGDLEHPHLYFFNNAQHHIRTLPIMQRDSLKPEDIDTNSEDHCFPYNTEIITDKGIMKIGDLVGKTGRVLSINGIFQKFNNCRMIRQNSELMQITFEDDYCVKCTPDHKFLTDSGMICAVNLNLYSNIVVSSLSKKNLPTLKNFVKYIPLENIYSNKNPLKVIPYFNYLLKVKKIEMLSKREDTFCLEVPETHSFALKNGVIVSNCMDSLRYLLARKMVALKRGKVGM